MRDHGGHPFPSVWWRDPVRVAAIEYVVGDITVSSGPVGGHRPVGLSRWCGDQPGRVS